MLKRFIDILIAIPLCIFFLPFWIIIGLLIRSESSGPAIYLHMRIGKDAKAFTCFKFRTMLIDSDPNKLAESSKDPRVTKFGDFLRKTSLDETLQFVNVLLGDMSIVGPRPALPIQVEHFNPEEYLKLSVKPGITGWTQINGRNSIPYNKRLELDVWYAKNHNLFLDFQIIFKTFGVLFDRSSIYDPKSLSPTRKI